MAVARTACRYPWLHALGPFRPGLFVMLAGVAMALAAGCASPGPPRPPSLHLPAPVDDLAAERVGDALKIRWTTPDESTDGLPLKDALSAEICETASVAEEACRPAARVPVHPGPSEATVPLAGAAAAGPPALLVVRMRVLNSTGRSAGWSAPAYTAAGSGTAPVGELRASAMAGGTRLEWSRVSGGAPVLLHRTLVDPVTVPGARGGRGTAAEADLEAADARGEDPGGVLDRTAEEDHTYRYVAQRVRTVTLAGHTIELRSEPSAAVTVRVHDVFPPGVPTGLLTVPGAPGEAAPAIELSWEPNTEPDLAGYWVERAEAAAGAAATNRSWTRLTPGLLTAPAFRDAGVVAGRRYLYRVIAVDRTGNASVPSAAVEETAAGSL